MKTEPLNYIMKDGLLYFKPKNSRVFIPEELPTKIYNKLQVEKENLEHLCNIAKKDAYFYPLSEKRTLMNFGPHTSVISNDISDKQLKELLITEADRTYKACNINK